MNQSQRYRLLAAVHLFFIKENKVLLLRRFQTGYEDGNYSVPAGHVDEAETVTQAAIREAQEETGLILQADDLRVAHVMHRLTDDERIDFFFWVTNWQGEPVNTEPDKCDELRWADLKRLPDNVIPYITFALSQCQAQNIYSEFGWK